MVVFQNLMAPPRLFIEQVTSRIRNEEPDSDGPEDAIIFVGVSLVLGIASRHALRGTQVPYTVALLLLGIALGALEFGTSQHLGKLGSGIRLWASIDPDLLLSIFLPALLFESSFSMDVHQIKKCMAQMLLLAGPGVVTSTFVLGSLLKLTFPYNWSWKTSLLLGGLLSATDPVAVVALLKDLGASKKLSTIIEGESLMNDGTAIVVYQLFFNMVLGQQFSIGSIIGFLAKVALGAVALGLVCGILSVLWLGRIFNDTVIEITLTVTVSYIAFFVAQDVIFVSGVLTVMTLGMFYAAVAKTAFDSDSQESLHHFWEMVAYIANTLIFILSGVVIGESVMRNEHHFENTGSPWGFLVLLYIYVQLSRVVVIGVLYPFLRSFGYGLDLKEGTVLVWSGLRGAVALALSLSVKRASDSFDSSDLKKEVGTLFVFFTGGIVFLTLIINGSTTQYVLHFLEMDRLSAAKIRILNYTRNEMLNKAKEAFKDLADDEELGPAADWVTVKKYISCFHDLEEIDHPHLITESQYHMHNMNLRDTRVRLLNGVQAAYWEMLDEGRITQTTGILLMQSVDEAMDTTVSDTPLCDWKGLKGYVRFPSYYRFLQMSRLPQRLVTYFTVERLESACYICAAFLRAHRIARMQLNEFIGESRIASTVIDESINEGEEARKFLEDVRGSFPQVLHAVKTKQVTYSVLKHLSEYVRNLEKVGLLEEKEMLHLDDDIQTDLKKLLRDPPVVKMPNVKDTLHAHPLIGVLPDFARAPIEFSTKEVVKMRGMTLYNEGSKPNGIWLISNGVVKWTSKRQTKRKLMHPLFTHGSTLGLYEVLTGKPYICDMIAESVVHCFFIEIEKITPLKAHPDIEEFLWQESAIVIAKLFLPPVFKELKLQELRSLIAERSRMKLYKNGEILEIGQDTVCMLMEGYLKSNDSQQSFVSAPAALFPSYVDLSFLSSQSSAIAVGSFYHRGTSYLVGGTARIIFVETGNLAGKSLQRKASFTGSFIEAQRTQAAEHSHSGLMSFPENLQMTRSHHQNFDEPDHHVNTMSSKALELNIYGSTVSSDQGRHTQGRSSSYRRIPSRTSARSSPRLIDPVQSEGEDAGTSGASQAGQETIVNISSKE